jgi:type IV secretory pathway component VirB8
VGEGVHWKRTAVAADQRRQQRLIAPRKSRQIGMFLVILAVVSAAIVAFIIYTMTLSKIREIAVLKLIGTRASVQRVNADRKRDQEAAAAAAAARSGG